jgi:serine phosphatase RsbU (regulator of sigma subunit)
VDDRQSTNGTFINGARVTTPTVLEEGDLLQAGHHVLRLERRSRRELQREEELQQDLDKASQYVRSLLPAPLATGAVRTDWCYQPSWQLGGDAFGYQWLDDRTFALYVVDVSGHGVGAAMHSLSVLNALRQRSLPDADLRHPAQVLADLNAMFQMERHNGMFFTMWYGVYDLVTRRLCFSCAGHHPAYLVPADRREAAPLKTQGLMIGAATDVTFRASDALVPADARLYLFSDGVFVATRAGAQWRLASFVPLLLEPPAASGSESERLYRAVKAAAPPGPLEDDFTLLAVTFT